MLNKKFLAVLKEWNDPELMALVYRDNSIDPDLREWKRKGTALYGHLCEEEN